MAARDPIVPVDRGKVPLTSERPEPTGSTSDPKAEPAAESGLGAAVRIDEILRTIGTVTGLLSTVATPYLAFTRVLDPPW